MLSDLADFDGHECVSFVHDRASGLEAIIAIHDSTRGPAHGGTRAWPYASARDAVVDALRLSSGMTFKNAVAGLPLGGGKSVIRLRPGQRHPTEAQLRAFGRVIEGMGGRYLPAEDIGMGPAEIGIIAEETAHVLGFDATDPDAADPSPMTALGIFGCIEKMLDRVAGDASLDGQVIAIQGLGGVGGHLARLVASRGGRLIVADPDTDRCRWARDTLGAEIASPDDIHRTPAAVFAPCALGGILNADTIPQLGARIVCGGANNQLSDDAAGRALAARGIAYAPDFVVNAGGVMWTSAPVTGLDRAAVEARVHAIATTLGRILDGMADGETPEEAALRHARDVLAAP